MMADKNTKDVIIVGTGVAGSLVAKLLTDHVYDCLNKKLIHRLEVTPKIKIREISILMLEAGLEAGVELESSAAHETYDNYLNTFYNKIAKTPNSPYPVLDQAPSPDVIDIQQINPSNPNTEGYLVQLGPTPFASDAIRVGGGSTMHWLGTTPRMLPNDFKTKEKYNRGVDWPLSYQELQPYYEMAEFEMGVSGDVSKQAYPNVDDIYDYYGKDYVFPMKEIPQSFMDLKIIESLEGKNIEINNEDITLKFVSSPQARNSIPNSTYKNSKIIKAIKDNSPCEYRFVFDDNESNYKAIGSVWNPYVGERCEGNASCVPICPVQAKYNALKTLKKALYKTTDENKLDRIESLEIKAQSVVYKLSVDTTQDNRISKLHLRKYATAAKSTFTEEVIDTSNSIVILAANAFENPKILLNSKYSKVENGKTVFKTVANTSNQVGRNLMDHPVMLTWGLFKEKVYPFRGPGSTTNLSSFRDGNFRSDFAPWISPLDNGGWTWPRFSPGSDVDEFLKQGLFGEELKNKLEERLCKQILIHFEFEQLPNPENRVMISDDYLDELGIPRPIIHYKLTDYEKKAMAEAKKISDKMFEMMGAVDYTQFKDTDYHTFVYNEVRYSFKGAGHNIGTHRMGDDPKTSVTNSYCKTWDHPNLYLIGAGNMPTSATSNPTLTMAAFTIRSVESIFNDLTNQLKQKTNETEANK